MEDRIKLPYRKNCEGYFFKGDKVLAQNTGLVFVLFPGGGIDEGESAKDAILRETFEETGAVIRNLKKIGVIRFDWAEDWAKTEKQKKRYGLFRGGRCIYLVGRLRRLRGRLGIVMRVGGKVRFLLILKMLFLGLRS